MPDSRHGSLTYAASLVDAALLELSTAAVEALLHVAVLLCVTTPRPLMPSDSSGCIYAANEAEIGGVLLCSLVFSNCSLASLFATFF